MAGRRQTAARRLREPLEDVYGGCNELSSRLSTRVWIVPGDPEADILAAKIQKDTQRLIQRCQELEEDLRDLRLKLEQWIDVAVA